MMPRARRTHPESSGTAASCHVCGGSTPLQCSRCLILQAGCEPLHIKQPPLDLRLKGRAAVVAVHDGDDRIPNARVPHTCYFSSIPSTPSTGKPGQPEERYRTQLRPYNCSFGKL